MKRLSALWIVVIQLLLAGLLVTPSFGGNVSFTKLKVIEARGTGVKLSVSVQPCDGYKHNYDYYLIDDTGRILDSERNMLYAMSECENHSIIFHGQLRKNLYVNPLYLKVVAKNNWEELGSATVQWSDEDDKIVQDALKQWSAYNPVTGEYTGK